MEIRTVAGAIGILLLVSPVGTATAVTELKGQITAMEVVGAGESHLVSPSPMAFFLHPRDRENLEYSVTASADVVVVNWTQTHQTGVGPNPLQPDQTAISVERSPPSQGERRFVNSTIHFDVDEPTAALLVQTVSSPNLEIDVDGELRTDVMPEATRWEVGKLADAIGAGGRPAGMVHGYDVPRHLLRVATGSEAQLLAEGDLVLHLWRGTVMLDSPEGRSSFRSGDWTANETQASHDEYTQLVSIHLSRALLELKMQAGVLESAIQQATWALEGNLAFADATAYLEAGTEYYRAENSAFGLSGSFSQSLDSAPGDSASFHDRITGAAIKVGLPPTGPLPTSGGFPWLSTLAAGLVACIAATGGVATARWLSRDVQFPLARAEKALVFHKSGRANRLSKRVLQLEPGNTFALFIYGASLLQKGAYEQVIKELEPQMRAAGENRSGLGFVLAYAHASLGHRQRASRWVRVAALDGRLVERMQRDRLLGAYVRGSRVYALGADVAYG